MSLDKPISSRFQNLEICGKARIATDSLTGSRVVLRSACDLVDPSAAACLRQIRHTGLPHLIDVVHTDDNSETYVFEYIEGKSLSQFAAESGGKIEPLVLLPVIARAARIIGFLHRQGEFPLVHLDIKPEHILLSDQGRVFLIDFGSLCLLDHRHDKIIRQRTELTPQYAAPEQLAGKICPASDNYALGLVMVQMLTGRNPASCRSIPPSSLLAGLPDGLQHLACRCLNSDPGQRYANADEMACEIEQLISTLLLPLTEFEPRQAAIKPETPDEAKEGSASGNHASALICVWGSAELGCELAGALAERESVLLIDADLMNPRADLLLGHKSARGRRAEAGRGSLDQALAEDARGHLELSVLNRLIEPSCVPKVSFLSSNSGLTNYDSHQLSSLLQVIHLARIVSRLVIVLCSRFIFDGFTCLCLQAADLVLVPTAADAGSFREWMMAIEFQISRFNLNSEKVSLVAFSYDVSKDLSRGSMDELSAGRLIGCVSEASGRRTMKSGAVPYAKKLDRHNRREYRDIIRRLRLTRFLEREN